MYLPLSDTKGMSVTMTHARRVIYLGGEYCLRLAGICKRAPLPKHHEGRFRSGDPHSPFAARA